MTHADRTQQWQGDQQSRWDDDDRARREEVDRRERRAQDEAREWGQQHRNRGAASGWPVSDYSPMDQRGPQYAPPQTYDRPPHDRYEQYSDSDRYLEQRSQPPQKGKKVYREIWTAGDSTAWGLGTVRRSLIARD